MCMGRAPTPQAPTMAEPQRAALDSSQRAGNRMRDRLRAMGGRQSTILTGGGMGSGSVAKPTILGG